MDDSARTGAPDTEPTLVQELLAARAEAVTAHVEAAVYTMDPQWHFTYVNPAAEALLGRECHDLFGRDLWDEFPDLVGSELEQIYRQTARDLQRYIGEVRYPPTDRDYAINVYGDHLGVSVCLRDAGERRLRLEERAATSELMHTVLEALPLSIVIMEPDGTILTASQRWGRMGEVMDGPDPADPACGNYFKTMEQTALPDEARQLRERIDALGSGPADDVRLDLRLHLRGEDVWFQVQASQVDQADLVVVTHTDVTSHVRARHSASWQATHDHLTSLANRAQLHDLLTTALRAPQRRPVALLFIDIDKFKSVNDRYGHDVGDDLLRAISRRLEDSTRADDTVARLGGDEFVVLSHPAVPTDAFRLEQRLRAAFDEPFPVGSGPIRISISIGVATATGGEDVRTLLRRADHAMYADKRRRRSPS